MRKSIISLVALSAVLLGAFQNCGKLGFSTGGSDKRGLASLFGTRSGGLSTPGDGTPSLVVNSHPRDPRKGTSVVITAIPQNLDVVSYSCARAGRPEVVVTSGELSEDQMMFKLDVDADLVCTFKGTNTALAQTISVPYEIDVQCGAQIKVGGACTDFVCHSFEQIAPEDLSSVPARTADGVCYYSQIMSGLARGASDSTAATDAEVLARNADGGTASRAPFVMDRWTGAFKLGGPRAVKLSGASDRAEPVIVDDLLLIGLHPADVSADPAADYRAWGSGLVTNIIDAHDSGAVKFKDAALSLLKFADDGSSSVRPIEVSNFVEVNRRHALDVRAEDTGGTRELSPIFLQFE